MTNLKTLKEMESNVYEDLGDLKLKANVVKSNSGKDFIMNYEMDKYFVHSKTLRQEAIRWIKKRFTWDTSIDESDYFEYELMKGKKELFMEFFNITENDLK